MPRNQSGRQARERRQGRTWHDRCKLARADDQGNIIDGEYIFGGEWFDVSPTRGSSFDRVRPQRPAVAFANYCNEIGVLPEALRPEEVQEPEMLEILNQLWEEHQYDTMFMDLNGARGASDPNEPNLVNGFSFKVPIDLMVDFHTSPVGRGAATQATAQKTAPQRAQQSGAGNMNTQSLQEKIRQLRERQAQGGQAQGGQARQAANAGDEEVERPRRAPDGSQVANRGNNEGEPRNVNDLVDDGNVANNDNNLSDRDREAIEAVGGNTTAEGAKETVARQNRNQPDEEGTAPTTASGRQSASDAAQQRIKEIANATASGEGAPEDEDEDTPEQEPERPAAPPQARQQPQGNQGGKGGNQGRQQQPQRGNQPARR